MAESKSATLYRMVLPDHVCPFGVKAKALLEEHDYTVEDNLLRSRDEVDDRGGAICFVDARDSEDSCPIDRAALLQRFHARENGRLLSGAAAFAAMWRAIPVLRPFGSLRATRSCLPSWSGAIGCSSTFGRACSDSFGGWKPDRETRSRSSRDRPGERLGLSAPRRRRAQSSAHPDRAWRHRPRR